MKILLMVGVFLLFSDKVVADFTVAGECNACTVEQAQERAALYQRANREATVYIFDYVYRRIHTFKVQSFLNPETGQFHTATKVFLPSLAELDLFANMTVFKNKQVQIYLQQRLGYDSVSSVMGCGVCQAELSTEIINSNTQVLMAAELSILASEIFNASEYHLNYKVDVIFSDGSQLQMHTVGGVLKPVKGSMVDEESYRTGLASAF